MSFEAFVWAWKQPVSTATDLHVLLALANVAPIRETYASASYIGKITRRSERQVRRSLQNLEAAEIITITERPGRTDLIRLNIPSDFVVTMPQEGDLEAGKRGRPRKQKTPDTSSENPGHNGAKPPPVVSDEPLEEPEGEPRLASIDALSVAKGSREAFSVFNSMAQTFGWERAMKLTDERRRHLNARIKDAGGFEEFCRVLNTIPDSPFLMGQVSSRFDPFVLSLDKLLRPQTFTRLMEGFYHRNRPNGSGPITGYHDAKRASHDRRTDAMLAGAASAFGARRVGP